MNDLIGSGLAFPLRADQRGSARADRRRRGHRAGDRADPGHRARRAADATRVRLRRARRGVRHDRRGDHREGPDRGARGARALGAADRGDRPRGGAGGRRMPASCSSRSPTGSAPRAVCTTWSIRSTSSRRRSSGERPARQPQRTPTRRRDARSHRRGLSGAARRRRRRSRPHADRTVRVDDDARSRATRARCPTSSTSRSSGCSGSSCARRPPRRPTCGYV